ncbi:MAG: ABC transporter ATP-binding protein [Lautropia sp.]
MTELQRRTSGSDADRLPPLMEARGLAMHFRGPPAGLLRRRRPVRSVDGIDLRIACGSTVGLVGESGCGKSTTARLLMRLLQPTAGQILLDGRDITRLSQAKLRPLRPAFQMIAQDPFSSLNPRMRVSRIIAEPLEIAGLAAAERRPRIQQALARVSLTAQHGERYPHEFSGGQRQRIAIARALVLQPRLLICDEPVSALDVSVQAQIINLLQDLQRDAGLTYLFVSHDLGVVKHIATEVAVMYLGRIVEHGPKRALFARPRHPYTHALLSAIPRVGARRSERIVLQGDLPSPIDPPAGCRFHTRCPRARSECRGEEPALRVVDADPADANPADADPAHRVACHFPL